MSYKRGDHYSRRARKEGYSARSVFKLEEIQTKWRLLRRGARVLDLGCAPGSWSAYARECVGADGTVVGVDIQQVDGFPGTFLLGAIEDMSADKLREALGGPADVVLSDMAPTTTGDRFGDHVRQVELVGVALTLCEEILAPGGHLVGKVFDGQDAPAFVQRVRGLFAETRRFKPKSTRGSSVEFFVVGKKRKSK